MLGKLLRYELKATGRTFLPLYGAILVVSLFFRIGQAFRIQLDLFDFIIAMVLFGLLVALGVMTILVTIQRFRNNLLSDEGYLMFTLPVSTYSLILSKLITTILWLIASVFVSVLSFFILFVSRDFLLHLGEFWRELQVYLPRVPGEYWLVIVQVLLVCLIGFISFVIMIYASLSVAQISVFHAHRGIVAFGTFFILNIITSILSAPIEYLIEIDINSAVSAVNLYLGITNLFGLVITAVLFFVTNYLLAHHLNID